MTFKQRFRAPRFIEPKSSRWSRLFGETSPWSGEALWFRGDLEGNWRHRRLGGKPPGIQLPATSPCPHDPTLVMVVFDDSGSVIGSNDPIGNRYEETRVAVEKLARACKCYRHEIAVLHFDRGTGGDVAPCRLDRRGRRLINQGLAKPLEVLSGYGTSELTSVLADAGHLAVQRPRHRRVLIVFSDYELTDPNPGWVLKQLCHFPAEVHAVVLGSPPPDQLMNNPAVAVTSITWSSPRGAVARTLFQAIVNVPARYERQGT
ncbi:vWA domain-containing protein [Streptosporangium carneum]|uniref:VWA domain-containing protein n=1 Tax=Streptosporangium carneum TaxID=47481 RepID=A0A9W6I604_9ACTN|nr:vWA domain-containing protein [Streptosporangium carneum]GLK12081.1 hypothetical protein GCM10017600_54890 [Streptosporangium carneum]